MENIVEDIVKAIKKRKCILVTGPSLYYTSRLDQKFFFDDGLIQNLVKKYKLKVQFEDVGRFSLSDIIELCISEHKGNQSRASIITDLKDDIEFFYKSQVINSSGNINSVLKKLSDLQFPLIINTTLDYLLFFAHGNRALFDYYHFKSGRYLSNYPGFTKESKTVEDLEKKFGQNGLTFIYNIYGTIDNQDSFLLTENDRLEFVKKIFKNYQHIPSLIRGLLTSNDSVFLILGFDLHEWHLKMLLFLFELYESSNIGYALDQYANSKVNQVNPVQIFYDNIYNCKFVSTSVEEFVTNIHSSYFHQRTRPAQDGGKVIFIGSKHKNDEYLLQELKKSLPLHLRNKAHFWDEITPGLIINDELNFNYINESFRSEECRLIVPVMSKDFFNSEKLNELLQHIISDMDEGNWEKKVLPILARDCFYREVIKDDMTILPRNQKDWSPFPLMTGGIIDEGLLYRTATEINDFYIRSNTP